MRKFPLVTFLGMATFVFSVSMNATASSRSEIDDLHLSPMLTGTQNVPSKDFLFEPCLSEFTQVLVDAEPKPLELPPKHEVKLRNGKTLWKGQDGISWMQALEAQAEVLGCKDKECFNEKIKYHVEWAYDGLDKGMRKLNPDLQNAVTALCADRSFPHKAGCIHNELAGLIKTSDEARARMQSEKRTLADLLSTSYVDALGPTALAMCSSSDEACLEKALVQIKDDALKGASFFNLAYKDLSALSAQTLLCEMGTDAVFPLPEEGVKSKNPEPKNRGWKGFGDGACPVANHGKAAIPAGPFAYEGAAPTELPKVTHRQVRIRERLDTMDDPCRILNPRRDYSRKVFEGERALKKGVLFEHYIQRLKQLGLKQLVPSKRPPSASEMEYLQANPLLEGAETK